MGSDLEKDLFSVGGGTCDDFTQVLEPSRHLLQHLSSLTAGFRARVKVCAKGFADLLDLLLHPFSLEEDDEHALVHLLALCDAGLDQSNPFD